MDNKNNKSVSQKGRFNIVDAIVIIAVLTLIALFVVILDPMGWFKEDSHYREAYLTYVVEIKNVDPEVLSELRAGDELFDASSLESIGTVVDPFLNDNSSVDGEGEASQEDNSKYNSVHIEIRVECVYKKDIGYIVNGKQIAVGTPINMTSSHFSGSGYCISIEE